MKEKSTLSFPAVAVIVLNYNGKKFLAECFNSLLAASYPNAELLLYDNCSTDDSLCFMKEHYPSVRLIAGTKNGGYSRAYNDALQYITAPYAVFLNNDVRVKENWLEPLVDAAEADAAVAALQPRLLLFEDVTRFEYSGAAGGMMDVYGFPFCRGRLFDTLEEDKGQYNDVSPVFWVSGAAFFVRTACFRTCGGLDEEFVHHMEEIDLCWRFHLRKYKLKSIPESVVYHHGGGTIPGQSFRKMYWNHRNSVVMLCKNLEAGNLVRALVVHLFWDIVAAAQSLATFKPGRFRAIVMAYLWLVVHPRMILRKRKHIQKHRVASDREVYDQLYPRSIVFHYFIKKVRRFSDLPDSNQFIYATEENSRIPQRADGNMSGALRRQEGIFYGDVPPRPIS